MRVLRTEGSDGENWTPRLCTHRGQPYAILSHRWTDDPNQEVLFADIEEVDELRFGEGQNEYHNIIRNTQYVGSHPGYKPGFRKVQGAARQALKDGFAYIWVDTCCIDKNSSAELSEAINSMWTWYKVSGVCYVYLADVTDLTESEFGKSSWWTRGWTLQELLAPRELIFFTASWGIIGPKKYMDQTISRISKIDPNVVNGTIDLQSVSVAQRMCWVSSRTTTRTEDMAYCLLGIFGVNMPLLYGEGENAFLRLQQEIIRDSDDESIFAWRDETLSALTLHGLLANSPQAFARSSKASRYLDTDTKVPFTMTNKGLSLTADIGIHKRKQGYHIMTLPCPNPENGDKYTRIHLKKISAKTEQYARFRCSEWAVEAGESLERKTIYIKQRYDQKADYGKPIISSSGIRLFRVVPAEDNDMVRIEMQGGDIETSRYSVVSYLGDGFDHALNERIWIGSEQLNVTQDLFLFLQMVGRARKDKLLWIGSICDTNTTPFENTSVLQHWRHIYTCAQECIVWLGSYNTTTNTFPRSYQATYETDDNRAGTPRRLLTNPRAHDFQWMLDCTGKRMPFTATYGLGLAIACHSYWRSASIIPELFLPYIVSIEYVDLGYSEPLLQKLTLTEVNRVNTSVSMEAGSLLNQRQRPQKPYLDFEYLLIMFRSYKSADPRDRVFALLAISDLSEKFEFKYNLSLSQLFLKICRTLEEKLTLTILPKLLTALEITEISEETPAQRLDFFAFIIVHAAYSLNIKDVRIDGPKKRARKVDRSLTEAYSYCTFELMSEARGGLVFVKESASTHTEQEKLYVPQYLYLRQAYSSTCSFFAIPGSYRQALTATTAILGQESNPAARFVLKTDAAGLRALAFCIPETPMEFPRVCQRWSQMFDFDINDAL